MARERPVYAADVTFCVRLAQQRAQTWTCQAQSSCPQNAKPISSCGKFDARSNFDPTILLIILRWCSAIPRCLGHRITVVVQSLPRAEKQVTATMQTLNSSRSASLRRPAGCTPRPSRRRTCAARATAQPIVKVGATGAPAQQLPPTSVCNCSCCPMRTHPARWRPSMAGPCRTRSSPRTPARACTRARPLRRARAGPIRREDRV